MNFFLSGAGAYQDPKQKHEDDVPKHSLQFFYPPKDSSKADSLTGGKRDKTHFF